MLSLFKSPIGVDFGTSSIRAVQLQGKSVTLAATVDIEEQRDDPDALGRRLDAFFAGLGLRGKRAVVNTPGSHTFIRTVMLPRMPDRELREAMMWEAKRQIPYPVEEAVFDYVSADSGDQVAVTFAASEKHYVEAHIAPLRAAGLDVVAVDINPLCLLRTVRPSTSGSAMVVDIGAISTEIHIVKAGVLRITRTVGTAGDSIKTRLMADGRSRAEADSLLREGSREALAAPLSDLSLEVFRSIDFYKATYKETGVSEIILTGAPAINPAVRAFFSESFRLPVSVDDPFKGLSLPDESMRPLGPMFSLAIGLARRQA